MTDTDSRAEAALRPALWTSTGTVAGDVVAVRDLLEAILHDTMTGDRTVMDAENPMGSYMTAAAYVAALNVHLCAQGLTPPAIDVKVDPLGFAQDNAKYLRNIERLVVEPAMTAH